MNYSRTRYYKPEFKSTGRNQHGERFKQCAFKAVCAVRMSCGYNDTRDISRLAVLSDQLDTPVRWDSGNKTYYIEVVSKEQLAKE